MIGSVQMPTWVALKARGERRG